MVYYLQMEEKEMLRNDSNPWETKLDFRSPCRLVPRPVYLFT